MEIKLNRIFSKKKKSTESLIKPLKDIDPSQYGAYEDLFFYYWILLLWLWRNKLTLYLIKINKIKFNIFFFTSNLNPYLINKYFIYFYSFLFIYLFIYLFILFYFILFYFIFKNLLIFLLAKLFIKEINI